MITPESLKVYYQLKITILTVIWVQQLHAIHGLLLEVIMYVQGLLTLMHPGQEKQ